MAERESFWFCYMLQCSDDSLYVGITTDVAERVKRHNWGVAAAHTAKRRPVRLIWSEFCGSSAVARAREEEIKSWNRKQKLALTGGRDPDSRLKVADR
ncbi:MAG: GIY-YIG nuclease family protein [Candidatus Acidiferrales bacterium]